MEFASPIPAAILEQHFDKGLLSQIDSLRMIRLTMAENMMRDLDRTETELKTRGLVAGEEKMDRDDLKKELGERIKIMRERIQRPDVVYPDEISMYVEMLENDQTLEESLAE